MARPLTVLGIAGSPVKGGNTDTLLDTMLSVLRERGYTVAKIYAYGLHFSPCDNCGKCRKSGLCPVDDDMRGIYPLLLESDIIIISSPVYFMSIPGQLKEVVDRCQCLWVSEKMLRKGTRGKKRRGFLISVGAAKYKNLFDSSVSVVKSLFCSLGVEYSGDLLVPGVDGVRAILKNKKALVMAEKAAKKLAN